MLEGRGEERKTIPNGKQPCRMSLDRMLKERFRGTEYNIDAVS